MKKLMSLSLVLLFTFCCLLMAFDKKRFEVVFKQNDTLNIHIENDSIKYHNKEFYMSFQDNIYVDSLLLFIKTKYEDLETINLFGFQETPKSYFIKRNIGIWYSKIHSCKIRDGIWIMYYYKKDSVNIPKYINDFIRQEYVDTAYIVK